LLSYMCPDGTQSRLGSPNAPDATRCGAWVQDAQDAQDAESRLGESKYNTTVSDAGHLFADGSCRCFLCVFFIWSLTFRVLLVILVFVPAHFLFGSARLLPFRVAQTQGSLWTLCCSAGSLLEFCRPFLFATRCSAFTGSACETCSPNLRRSFLLFSSCFSFGICFLCWL